MSDSKRNPKDFPPDDFSKTTPNFRVPGNNYPSASNPPSDEPIDDWSKTNYNFSPKNVPPAADEWGRNQTPAAPPPRRSLPEDDFGKTITPGSQPRGGGGDYGATQVNINIPRENLGSQNDYGAQAGAAGGATTPYFRLPESERAKYQNLPPASPAAAAQTQNDSPKKKGGIPGWLWAIGGLSLLFLFAVGVLGLVWFFFLPKTGFELTVKGAPPGSDIFVDGQRWNLSSADGSYKLPGLKAGEIKTIDIRRAGYACKPQQVTGDNGVPKEIVAQCSQEAVVVPPNDCANIKKGDFAKAAKCANDGLDNLKDPISVDDLLKAMNMYIINFPSGKFDIVKPEDKAFLQKAAALIQKLPPTVVIEVGGHTDNVGNKASNQTLSDNRAKSVKTALVGFGVKDSVLQAKGYGDAKPKASNDTDDGKFQNRRIEYSALSK